MNSSLSITNETPRRSAHAVETPSHGNELETLGQQDKALKANVPNVAIPSYFQLLPQPRIPNKLAIMHLNLQAALVLVALSCISPARAQNPYEPTIRDEVLLGEDPAISVNTPPSPEPNNRPPPPSSPSPSPPPLLQLPRQHHRQHIQTLPRPNNPNMLQHPLVGQLRELRGKYGGRVSDEAALGSRL